VLIAARAFLAVGAAAMMPATLSLIHHLRNDRERGIAIGVWGDDGRRRQRARPRAGRTAAQPLLVGLGASADGSTPRGARAPLYGASGCPQE
jgi:hypothetical protein